MATFDQIMGARNLLGVFDAVKTGVPQVLQPGFYTPNEPALDGIVGEYWFQNGNRAPARKSNYGSPAKPTNQQGLSMVPIVVSHSFESTQLNPSILINLLDPEASDTKVTRKQEKGIFEVMRQLKYFKSRFEVARTTMAQLAIFQGVIYFDKDGAFTSDSAVAANGGSTISQNIPSSNQGVAPGVTGWATTTTDIIGQLQAIQKKAIQTTGYPIMNAAYGINVPSYIGANATAQQYLKFQQQMGAQYVGSNSPVPQGFGGIKNWIPAYNAFYANQGNNTVIQEIGDNQVIFFPDPEPDWYGVIEGSEFIPMDVNVQGDPMAALRSLEQRTGMYLFAKCDINPPTLTFYAGDNFLTVIKNPQAIWQCTVN